MAFLLDYLVNGYIRRFRVEELLFFTDLLREINPERNMPELGSRSFRMDVEIKAFGVYYVQELAEKCVMEYGSFRKRFKKEFGISPYKWLMAKRAEHIKYRLSMPYIPFVDIINEFNFSSSS